MRRSRISRLGLCLEVALGFGPAVVAPAFADHRPVFINGLPVPPATVMQIEQVIGVRLAAGHYGWDGQFLYDGNGNAVPLSWGGGVGGTGIGGRISDIIIDPSGGCEAGSCVNILD